LDSVISISLTSSLFCDFFIIPSWSNKYALEETSYSNYSWSTGNFNWTHQFSIILVFERFFLYCLSYDYVLWEMSSGSPDELLMRTSLTFQQSVFFSELHLL
jgi:hypothetical protein